MNSSSAQGLTEPVSTVPHILIVDDHDDSVVLLVCVLDSMGCSYQTANCASVALNLAQQQGFDLALLDIVLPDLNGIDLLKRLKQEKRHKNLTAIAVTALAFSKDQKKIQQAGFNGYICKPYLLNDIEEVIRSHLNSKLPSNYDCAAP